MRAGKVSMGAYCVSLLTCSCVVMRTRPRPNDIVARVHKVRGALDMHRPKRSVDGQSAKHRLHVIPNKPTSRMLRIPLVANANIRN